MGVGRMPGLVRQHRSAGQHEAAQRDGEPEPPAQRRQQDRAQQGRQQVLDLKVREQFERVRRSDKGKQRQQQQRHRCDGSHPHCDDLERAPRRRLNWRLDKHG